jgi:hypothetical protein
MKPKATPKEIDEDLIPYYFCRSCHNKVCKDEAFKRQNGSCICLDCSNQKTLMGE